MNESERIQGRALGRRWRCLISCLLLLLLLTGSLATALAQTATVVRVEDTEIEADGSGAAPLVLEGSPGIVAMHIEITYDPDVLEWEELEQGDLLAGSALVEANADQPGRVIIGFATLDGASGDGELLRASFASTGAEETTTVGLENVQAWDANGFDVLIETQNGEVSIDSGFPLWLLLILGILVLLFLLVVGLLVWFLRRRARQAQPQATPAPVPQPQPQPQAQQPPQPQPQEGQQARARFCSNCGQPLNPGAAFCSNCGTQAGQQDS